MQILYQKFYWKELGKEHLDILFFFDSKHLQTYVDSVNQSSNSTFMSTTKVGWFLALRAKLSALRFAVRGT